MTTALVFLGIVLLVLAFALIFVGVVARAAFKAIKSEYPTLKKFIETDETDYTPRGLDL